MNTTKIRSLLRKQRQEGRLHSIGAEDRAKFPAACRAFLIYGGDLEKIKAYPDPQTSKRNLRHARAGTLRSAIRAKLEKDNKPASFQTVKRMAAEFTRKAIKRIQKKGVM